jgi:hypothetical protein
MWFIGREEAAQSLHQLFHGLLFLEFNLKTRGGVCEENIYESDGITGPESQLYIISRYNLDIMTLSYLKMYKC